MQVLKTISELRQFRKTLRLPVGLVPTMGALHEGHLALVRQALAECESVIATIFVNPAQFGPSEDLDNYPRTLPRDLALLEQLGVDGVFTPTDAVMYPDGYQTYVNVRMVTQRLEGANRPGHFQGVTTVVTKLLNLTQPDRAYFGQKDAQQVVTVKRMIRDLNIPVHVVVVPTVREADGLALSSRNAYLGDDAERQAALVLSRALYAAAGAYEAGERAPVVLKKTMQVIVEAQPLANLDYIAVVDPVTLESVNEPTNEPLLLLVAAQVGQPRLLDNMLLPVAHNTVEGFSAILGGFDESSI